MNIIQDQMKDLLRRMDEMSSQLSSINEKASNLLDALVNRTNKEDYELRPKYTSKPKGVGGMKWIKDQAKI